MLEDLTGIGSKTKQALSHLGIDTLEDLIDYYPYRYELVKRSNIEEKKEDDDVIVDGIVMNIPRVVYFKKHLERMTFQMQLQDRMIEIVIFNRGYLKKHLNVGTSVTVFGKWKPKKNQIVASKMKLGMIEKTYVEPIYHLTNKITNQKMIQWIHDAFQYAKIKPSMIPHCIEEKYQFLKKEESVLEIHHPTSTVHLKQARTRLKYEELFEFLYKMTLLKETRKRENGLKRTISKEKIKEMIDQLPFSLTMDQKEAVKDIFKDMENESRMNRLIQGDVGSGKTILAFIASYMNYLSGYQTAFMAPTEILAIQHYEKAKELLEPFHMKVVLLTGKLKVSEKKKIQKEIETGEVDLIIGTHALISSKVTYSNLGLVITDEQHRFGVQQRRELKNKGMTPDILYMSATPIPRTYALTIYGDMEVSNIKTKPMGRKEIETLLYTEKELKDVLIKMYEELKKGHQIYVIAPLIEENEESNAKAVDTMYENMKKAFGKLYQIDMLHGKQDGKKKETIMNAFKENKIQILISTTVIEVGVDVSNATMIVIFNAERFGLSQLHQLRGRVGRSDLQSYCLLVSNYDKERLQIMTKVHDGFEISEEDFRLRGSGDFFGNRQSGDMNFKLADVCHDFKILRQAKEDAELLVQGKLNLTKEEELYFKNFQKSMSHLD